jgi:type I restriction enzyme S subunit
VEFKQTQIGKIPKEWEVGTLRDVVDNDDDIVAGPFGSNLKVSDYRETGIPIIRLQNIERNNFVYKDIKYVSQKKAEELKYHSFRAGDIVLAKLGDPIGKASIVPSSLERGIVVADVVRIRLSTRRVSSFFVEYILNSPICTVQLQKETIGTTRPRVNIFQIRNLKFPLPPLPEQKRIAEILSTVDQAILKVDEAKEKAQKLKKGLMQELLTKGIGHKEFKDTEIGRIPKTWKVMRLGDAATVRYGLGQPPALETNGIPMIRATNVKRGKIAKEGLIFINPSAVPNSRDPFLRGGDILVVRSGAYTGDVALVTKEWEGAVAGYDLIVTPSDIIDSQFLTYYLLSSSVQKRHFVGLKVRSAQPHLNSSQVEETPIPLPSPSEQQKIAEILSTVDARLELLRKRKDRLVKIKKGFMDSLLTGRIRVKIS